MKNIKVLNGGVDVRDVEQVMNNIAFTVVSLLAKRTTKRPPVSYANKSSHSCYAKVAQWLLQFDKELTSTNRIICFGHGFEKNVYHAILTTSLYSPVVDAWQGKGTYIRNERRVITGFCPQGCVEESDVEENYHVICDISIQDFRKKYTKL